MLLSANLFTLPVFRGVGLGAWSMGSSHRGFIALWKHRGMLFAATEVHGGGQTFYLEWDVCRGRVSGGGR